MTGPGNMPPTEMALKDTSTKTRNARKATHERLNPSGLTLTFEITRSATGPTDDRQLSKDNNTRTSGKRILSMGSSQQNPGNTLCLVKVFRGLK